MISDLEADTEREGEGDDDEEPGDGGEEPATHPNTSVRVRIISWQNISEYNLCMQPLTSHGILLPVDADSAHMGASLPILMAPICVNL